MGGEGAIMSMINSLKTNNRRRKNHLPFSKTISGSYSKEKPVYDFPEVTPEVLETIKLKMIKERKVQDLKTLLVFVSVIVLILIIII